MSAIVKFENFIVYLMQLRVDELGVIPAVNDDHATEKLKSLSGRQIVMAYPGIDAAGIYLEQATRHVTIHVLEQTLGAQRTEEKELEQYRSMLATVHNILARIQADASSCTKLSGIKDMRVNINPTYNIYGNWGGWMMEIDM